MKPTYVALISASSASSSCVNTRSSRSRRTVKPNFSASARRFLLRVTLASLPYCEYLVLEANAGAPAELLGLNDVEWHLVSPITLKDVPAYEAAIRGVTAALSKWLEESTYDA